MWSRQLVECRDWLTQPDYKHIGHQVPHHHSEHRVTSSMKVSVLEHWELGAGAKIHFKLDFLLKYLCALPGSPSYLVIKAKL